MNHHFPLSIKPMEPLPLDKVFDQPDFIYQVKWDGVRMLAYITSGQVQLVNKRQHLRTAQYPELQKLIRLVDGQEVILDGEIVVLQNGKPSFPAVMRRDLSGPDRAKSMLQQLPINFMVFDLLYLAGKDLCSTPLKERQQQLNKILHTDETILLVDNFPRGSDLFAAVKAQDMEGIVAKRHNSCYTQGKHHHDWFKIKYRRIQTCVIGGYTCRGKLINALLLGIYRDKELYYVGKVGSGLKSAEWLLLTTELPKILTRQSPFCNLPVHRKMADFYFIEPRLQAQIEFAEWTEKLTLRSPVIKGFITGRA
ncbi:non-homologous end-joining DNA ligase [Syntrophomonas erecta subsp. sporosyntropha]